MKQIQNIKHHKKFLKMQRNALCKNNNCTDLISKEIEKERILMQEFKEKKSWNRLVSKISQIILSFLGTM